jgi:hypothetical protein
VPIVPPLSLLPGSVPPVVETTAASEEALYVSMDEVISLGGRTPTRRQQPTRFPKQTPPLPNNADVSKDRRKRHRKPQDSGSEKKSKKPEKEVVSRLPAVPVSIQKVLVKKVPTATPSPITHLQAENVTAHTPTNNQDIIDHLAKSILRSELLHDKAIQHNNNVQVSTNGHNQQMEYTRLLLSTPAITDNHIKVLEMFQKK